MKYKIRYTYRIFFSNNNLMNRRLTNQELHNLAMNIVGKDLRGKGYEFLAVNSQLKRHPQFVCIDADKQQYFVIVKVGPISNEPISYDVIWMETFKNHARKQKAKVLFAAVGLGAFEDHSLPPNLSEDYALQYEGLESLDVNLN